MPLPIASDSSTARSISARDGFVGDDIEMVGLAADDRAERDEAVIVGAAIFGAVEREGDHGRDFQRAGHGHDIVGRAGLVERRLRAVEQRVGQVVVKARLDDQEMRLASGRLKALPWSEVPAMSVSGSAGDLGRTQGATASAYRA